MTKTKVDLLLPDMAKNLTKTQKTKVDSILPDQFNMTDLIMSILNVLSH